MEKLVRWLRQPYPLKEGASSAFVEGAVGFVFVALFLFVFRPFGTPGDDVIPSGQWLLICLQFGGVTFAVTLVAGLLARRLPGVFVEERWQIWKEILWTATFISCIGAGNMVFAAFRFGDDLSLGSFLMWQWVTFSVGVFPASFGVFMKQASLMRRYAAEAAAISEHIHHQHHALPTPPPALVSLVGENQNETIRLAPADLRYISAADNYVQVFFWENGALRSRLLRGTLKKMEDALAEHPQFFRCHRTYLVNLDHVAEVSGNAQGYRLRLEGAEATVPVSRALNDEIKRRLGE